MKPAMLTRRGFFGAIAGAAVGVVASPELIELLQPSKTIMLPPAGGWPRSAGQLWTVRGEGGYLYSQQLQRLLQDSARRWVQLYRTDSPEFLPLRVE